MRFSRIELTNWKNFQEVNVELPHRVFLVGPNASGKSNFLDAFRFLRDLARPGGGLKNACEARGGVSKIRCLSARKRSDIEIAVTLTDDNEETSWTYRVAFTQDSQYPRKGVPKLLREVVLRNTETIVERPDESDTQDPLRLTQTALEQVTLNREFREVADFFTSVSYLHLIPQIVRSGALSSDPNIPDIYGGNFLERVAKTQPKIRNARLKRIVRALQFAVPQLKNISLERDERGIPHLEVRYHHWRYQPAKQDETQLSDGTLRLLALLWILEENTGTLLMEEPELSLHTAIVRRLAALIYRANRRKRQAIISTHSADLLSDEGIGGEETLLFEPSNEGTRVYSAASHDQIRALLETGLTVAEVVFPHTEPQEVVQLSLL